MVNHTTPVWFHSFWNELYPEGVWKAVKHPGAESTGPGSKPWEQYTDEIVRYGVPNDKWDYVAGISLTAVILGGIALVYTPAGALAFAAVPGTMTVTFFAGVVVSNYLQEQL